MREMAYKRPPITEAVIELRFAQQFEQRDVEKAARRLRDEYAYEDPENAVKVQFNADTRQTQVETSWLGVKLSSADRADIAIFRTGSLVISRLAPYTGWEAFQPRAARAWEEWRKAAGRTELQRIGVRYVNRIDVDTKDKPLIRVEDYINVWPRSPEELGEPMSGYAMQILRPLGADDCSLVMTSAIVPSPLVEFTSFVLDLDVYRDINIPKRDDELLALLDKMRHHKNRVFESCITDRARAIFNQ